MRLKEEVKDGRRQRNGRQRHYLMLLGRSSGTLPMASGSVSMASMHLHLVHLADGPGTPRDSNSGSWGTN